MKPASLFQYVVNFKGTFFKDLFPEIPSISLGTPLSGTHLEQLQPAKQGLAGYRLFQAFQAAVTNTTGWAA